MATAEIRHIFPLSADQFWDLIGDFGDTGKWSGRPPEACLRSGRGVGALRTLTLADGRQIVDRLEAQGDKFMTYSIVTSPFPVVSYKATMAVSPLARNRVNSVGRESLSRPAKLTLSPSRSGKTSIVRVSP